MARRRNAKPVRDETLLDPYTGKSIWEPRNLPIAPDPPPVEQDPRKKGTGFPDEEQPSDQGSPFAAIWVDCSYASVTFSVFASDGSGLLCHSLRVALIAVPGCGKPT